MTANGKIDRAQLARALNNESDGTAPNRRAQMVTDGVEKIIVDLVVEETSQSLIDVDTNFFELGVGSLGLVRILSRLEQELGEKISPVTAFSNPTVRLLARAISNEAIDVRRAKAPSATANTRRSIRARRAAKLGHPGGDR